jgi:hypothetical protein
MKIHNLLNVDKLLHYLLMINIIRHIFNYLLLENKVFELNV